MSAMSGNNGKQLTDKDIMRYWVKVFKKLLKEGKRPRIVIAFKITDALNREGSFTTAYPGMTHEQAASVLAMCLEGVTKRIYAEKRNKIIVPS